MRGERIKAGNSWPLAGVLERIVVLRPSRSQSGCGRVTPRETEVRASRVEFGEGFGTR